MDQPNETTRVQLFAATNALAEQSATVLALAKLLQEYRVVTAKWAELASALQIENERLKSTIAAHQAVSEQAQPAASSNRR